MFLCVLYLCMRAISTNVQRVCVGLSVSQLEESLKLSPDHFQLQFEVKAPGKDDDNIVFHCQKGRRSAEALAIARQLGFNR